MPDTERIGFAGTERIGFVGVAGAELAGVLHRAQTADGAPPWARGVVLMAHCFTCGKDLHTVTRMARGLARAGFHAFRFDFTGLGESGGEFADTTVSSNVGDLTRAAFALIQRNLAPSVLIGHSLGAAAVALAAPKIKTARAVVMVAPPSDVGHIRGLIDATTLDDVVDGRSIVIGPRSFVVGDEFLADIADHSVTAAVSALGCPLLLLHGDRDDVVGLEHSRRLFESAQDPKRLVVLKDADHLLSDRTQAEVAVGEIVRFVAEFSEA